MAMPYDRDDNLPSHPCPTCGAEMQPDSGVSYYCERCDEPEHQCDVCGRMVFELFRATAPGGIETWACEDCLG